jgi:NitT/TauT family transport system ATP-binding protein
VNTPKTAATPRLALHGVSKSFTGRNQTVEVLRDVSMDVAPGEFVAILGASGCGKTTLLRIADGLEGVDAGAVLVNGQRRNAPGRERGFVFQQDSLFPWRTVIKNVSLGMELQGVPRKVARERAQEFVKLVGLGGFEKHYPHEMSGGMRQRANLARAFAIQPELLLMDEPFAALDAQTREIMQLELLRIWQATEGGSVLFITHQIDEAVLLADRVVVMTSRPGRIKEIVDVDFPRPRDLQLKRRPEFVALVDRLWKLIEDEVKESIAIEGA